MLNSTKEVYLIPLIFVVFIGGGGVTLERIIVKCVSNVLKLQTNAQFDSDRQVHAAHCFLVDRASRLNI